MNLAITAVGTVDSSVNMAASAKPNLKCGLNQAKTRFSDGLLRYTAGGTKPAQAGGFAATGGRAVYTLAAAATSAA